ncbi:hypothetical protein LSUE1_G008373 [Lachnellula suecica]|uniref:DUF7907 domain-containing protein n=1 Tax=Lachnellula suecica TaxID=602035 RepID=A0A8T9C118_9HELO|nr:hypothetical protein LSUE1_G008373 [Lachnellula suecica]
MVFIKTASAFALLSTLASTAPTSTPIYPPYSNSESFNLIANVTSGDLSPSINGWGLTSYHTGAGTAYAVLSPSSPRIFYANGTAEEIRYNSGNILSDEGTPLFPGGLVINAPTTSTPSEVSLSVNAGVGTSNVGITHFPDPVNTLYALGGEGFYACERVPFPGAQSAVMVFQTQSEGVPAGCAEVVFLPQCSEGSGAVHPTGAVSGCYADVAAIDWSIYYSS